MIIWGQYSKERKMPKSVSVIVPNYNYGQYLYQRLDSIVKQSYSIHEIIIIDDGSQDNSLEVIESFIAGCDLDIILLKSRHNSGSVFGQWLKGIEHAKGDYIWIAEADDLSLPDFLSTAMGKFDNPDVVLSFTMSKVINWKGDILQEDYLVGYDNLDTDRWRNDYIRDGKEEIADTFVVKNIIPNASSAVFKKSAFSGLVRDKLLSYKVAGDWYFYCKLLERGEIAFSHRALNLWRRHGGSVSASAENNRRHFRELVELQEWIRDSYPVSAQSWERALRHRADMGLWLKVYDPFIKRYLFLVDCNHQGSQKILSFLNGLDGVKIRRDDREAMLKLYENHCNTIRKREEETGNDPGDRIDFYHYSAKLCKAYVEEILHPSSGGSIFGSHLSIAPEKSNEYKEGLIDFLLEFFPGAHLLLVYRGADSAWIRHCHTRHPHTTLPINLDRLDGQMLYKIHDFTLPTVKV